MTDSIFGTREEVEALRPTEQLDASPGFIRDELVVERERLLAALGAALDNVKPHRDDCALLSDRPGNACSCDARQSNADYRHVYFAVREIVNAAKAGERLPSIIVDPAKPAAADNARTMGGAASLLAESTPGKQEKQEASPSAPQHLSRKEIAQLVQASNVIDHFCDQWRFSSTDAALASHRATAKTLRDIAARQDELRRAKPDAQHASPAIRGASDDAELLAALRDYYEECILEDTPNPGMPNGRYGTVSTLEMMACGQDESPSGIRDYAVLRGAAYFLEEAGRVLRATRAKGSISRPAASEGEAERMGTSSWVLCGNCGFSYNKMEPGAEDKHGIRKCNPRAPTGTSDGQEGQ